MVTGVLEGMILTLSLEVNGYVYEWSLWLKWTLILDGTKHQQFPVTLH